MRKSLKIVFWVAVVVALLALAERQVFGSWDHVIRYRFTMEIDDNGKIRHGTTVQELHCWFNDGMFKGIGSTEGCGTKGDALVIDMGDRGYLFALLQNDEHHPSTSLQPAGVFMKGVLGPDTDGGATDFYRVYLHFGRKIDIKLRELPLLVRFSNIEDALTLQKVDPYHLDTVYGPGVKIKSASVELTFGWMNSGIKKLLIWDQRPKVWLKTYQFNGREASVDERPYDLRIPIEDFSNENGG